VCKGCVGGRDEKSLEGKKISMKWRASSKRIKNEAENDDAKCKLDVAWVNFILISCPYKIERHFPGYR
jgi:hypothetical protein